MIWDIPQMVTTVAQIVNKFVPDRDQQIKLEAELSNKLADYQQVQLTAQSDIDKVEATSPSFFVAGWRPAAGWLTVFGLAWATTLQPIAEFAAHLCGYKGTFPVIQSDILTNLLLALLGMAGWRSLDKIKGVATSGIK